MRKKIAVGRGTGDRPREQQTEQAQAAKPEPTRRQRRTERANRGPAGRGAVRTWHHRYVDGLLSQAGRLGITKRGALRELLADPWDIADRKRICVALQREQARLAGVTNAQWAALTREERGWLVDYRAYGGLVTGRRYAAFARKGIAL